MVDGKEALSCGYQYTNVPGYVYQVYGATQNNVFCTNGSTVDYKNYNNMYCGRNGDKGMYESSYGYWLASPSAYNSYGVCRVDCYGAYMRSNDCSNAYVSLAPLVSLKSDVKIEIYE
jgi:hypothetical protein